MSKHPHQDYVYLPSVFSEEEETKGSFSNKKKRIQKSKDPASIQLNPADFAKKRLDFSNNSKLTPSISYYYTNKHRIKPPDNKDEQPEVANKRPRRSRYSKADACEAYTILFVLTYFALTVFIAYLLVTDPEEVISTLDVFSIFII